jgi:hypothetical protein
MFMIAGIYNITIEQGSTFVRLLSIEQPDITNDPSGETFIPFDLNGYTARMQIRRTIESSTAMISLTTENGGIDVIPETAVNEIKLLITAANTATLETSGVYDLEIIDSLGNVSKVVRGSVTLIPEVTK